MDTYIYINDEWRADGQDKTFHNILTGEIISDIEKQIEILEKERLKNRADKNSIKRVEELIGLKEYFEKYHINWKKKSHFNKIYRTEIREFLKDADLSVNASALMLYLMIYIEYPTNRIAKPNKESFTNKDLQDISKLGSVQLKNALNELEDKNIIKRVGKRQAREIYFNPYLSSGGKDIKKETIKLFNNNYNSLTPY